MIEQWLRRLNIEPERAASGFGLTSGMLLGVFLPDVINYVSVHPYASVLWVWVACCGGAAGRAIYERRR